MCKLYERTLDVLLVSNPIVKCMFHVSLYKRTLEVSLVSKPNCQIDFSHILYYMNGQVSLASHAQQAVCKTKTFCSYLQPVDRKNIIVLLLSQKTRKQQ